MLESLLALIRSGFKPVKETPAMLTTPPNPFTGSHLAPDWEYMWDTCKIDDHRRGEVFRTVNQIIGNVHRYRAVERQTGVPWKLIAAIHYRESTLRFSGCLHNGDPLPGPTRNVPKGRGPFGSWEHSAIDALRLVGFHRLGFEDDVACLVGAETFNGKGYRRRGEYSPYVWAGTNWSDERGKFVADGRFDKEAPERQLGVAALILELNSREIPPAVV